MKPAETEMDKIVERYEVYADPQGETLMHHAAWASNVKDVRALIKAGFGVDVGNNWGVTPLGQTSSVAVARELVAAGADVNAYDAVGESPLHYATSAHMVNALVGYGAAVNAHATNGMTPLHNAAQFGRWRIMKTLLAHGARPTGVDYNGRSLLANARGPCARMVARLALRGQKGDDDKTVKMAKAKARRHSAMALRHGAKLGCVKAVDRLMIEIARRRTGRRV